MIAVGYTLVYGVLRLINFAHSEVFTSGGFAGYFILKAIMGSSAPTGIASVGLIVLGVVAGGTTGACVATVLERVAYRPLRRRNAPKLAYLISAIGASYFLFNMYGKEFGRYSISLPQPYVNHTVFHIFGANVQMYYIIIFIAAAIMLLSLDRVVQTTKLGRAIRAVAQDAETASLMGVNIDRTIAMTFVVGGALGGAAGFLFAMGTGVVYTMGFMPALKAFTAAVLGGIGNLRGAMLGGLLLGDRREPRGRLRPGGLHRRRRVRDPGPRPHVPADRDPRRAPGAGGVIRAFVARPPVKRLLITLGVTAVVELMTGPPGSRSTPGAGSTARSSSPSPSSGCSTPSGGWTG